MAVIGARIRSLREDRGWEAGQLGYKAEVSTSMIYKLETNERPNVSGVILDRLATALGTSVDYLMGRTNDPRPHPPADDLEDDPELILRRQRLADRIANLPPDRQIRVMDAITVLTEVEAIGDAVEDEEVAPQDREPEQANA